MKHLHLLFHNQRLNKCSKCLSSDNQASKKIKPRKQGFVTYQTAE